MEKNYYKEIASGKEVVIVAKYKSMNSAIFWANEAGDIVVFTKEMGEAERSKYVYTPEMFNEHCAEMIDEGHSVFVRGNAE